MAGADSDHLALTPSSADPLVTTVTVNARSPMALAWSAGMRLRQYELIRELGRGGMGMVWLARDTRLGRRVAIKFLMNTGGREQAGRFLAEARATARCSHENIVVIHEVDEVRGTPYMILEYLEGAPLRERMFARRLPWGYVVELAVPIVRALQRAHDFGIVHRDLKPENVFVTREGAIKVLDFGIAKLFTPEVATAPIEAPSRRAPSVGDQPLVITAQGTLIGTLPYMSPEQLGIEAVDHRTDFYAFGVMLWEMLVGRHPVQPLSQDGLLAAALQLNQPLPRVDSAIEVPAALADLVARCVAKPKDQRYASARALLDDLEALLPLRAERRPSRQHESPYPGLLTFQEADADRFFGRNEDVTALVTRLSDQPLLAVIGPSGVGKSSLVRAGLVPALRNQGVLWDVMVLRPGPRPLAGLAAALQAATGAPQASTAPGADEGSEGSDHEQRLRREPGYLGRVLRAHAARKGCQFLLFLDQFEELYTLVTDAEERQLFTACLRGAADDPGTPVRVLLSMRSDFIDRLGENRGFIDDLARGIVFVQPLGRAAIRAALTRPLQRFDYRFESERIVTDMLDKLATTPGALPLLQFAASRLWDSRDPERRLLTSASYHAMGGITGALASHADNVLAALPADLKPLARTLLRRLVTPERTRAVVEVSELSGLASEAGAMDRLLDQLVTARLLVVQKRGIGEGATVELVHETLIHGWPTLKRWLDETQEHAAFLAQVRAAARQWELKGRPQGLLWRGEAAEEARLFGTRYLGHLAADERRFLDAVSGLLHRTSRVRRVAMLATIAFLAALVAASAVALVKIRGAEQAALREKERTQRAAVRAQNEADRARLAKEQATAQYDLLLREQNQRARAEQETAAAKHTVMQKDEDLRATNARLEQALAEAEREKTQALRARADAVAAAKDADQQRKKAEELFRREQARRMQLEERKKKIATEDLK